MAAHLTSLDLAVIVLYFTATILLGVWFSRRQANLKTYFVGNRNMSWWLLLVSIIGTETSTVTFLSVPGLAFDRKEGDLAFLQLAFGFIIGRLIIAAFLLPQYMRGELFSAYELLRQRFNASVQRTASAIFMVTRTLADGLRLYLTGLLLQIVTGWSIEASVLVMGLAILSFTYLGGMQAVVWTDLIQFVIYILGAILAGLFLVWELPGGIAEMFRVGEEAGKLVLFRPEFDLTQPYTLWAGLIGGAFLTMGSHGADQLMVQRYLCARSLGQARAALILSGFGVLIQFLLFLLIGVGLYALHVHGGLALADDTRNDQVFGIFITNHLPAGLVGLVVAAVLAAAMSSSLNSSANALVTDFYRPLRPGRTDGHYLFISKVMTAFWGVAQIAVALVAVYVQSRQSIVTQVLSVAGFTTGLLLGLFILGSLRRPVRSAAALIGLLAGFAAALAAWLPSTWNSPDALAWPWYAPIGTLTTVGVGWLAGVVASRSARRKESA